jgi:hypothetical protein
MVAGTVNSRYCLMSDDIPNMEAAITRIIEYFRTEAKYSLNPWCGISPRY